MNRKYKVETIIGEYETREEIIEAHHMTATGGYVIFETEDSKSEYGFRTIAVRKCFSAHEMKE